MDAFPVELLQKIFTFLPLIQKQECLFVSRSWEKAIRENLFQTVSICNVKIYRKFCLLIEQSPLVRYQVKYLTLHGCFGPRYDKRNVLALFPNLRVLRLCMDDPAAIMNPYQVSDAQTELFSKNGIQHLEDYGHCELTLLLIMSGNCTHLTTLKLNFHKLNGIYFQLKNMPALKHLCISNSSISLNDYDTIHNNLPSLKTIKLENLIYLTDGPPNVIVPAPQVSCLEIEMFDLSLQEHLDWFDLIIKKFPNLESLNYWHSFNKETRAQRFYRDGYTPLIQSQRHKMKHLTLYNLHDSSIIQRLDESGCHLSSLEIHSKCPDTLLNSLSLSDQSDSLKHLAVVIDKQTDFGWLKSMKTLNSIDMSYSYSSIFDIPVIDSEAPVGTTRYPTLDLYHLFRSCPPTLEKVCIRSTALDLGPNVMHTFPSIKSLKLDGISTPFGLDTFISRSFPNLHSLTLNNYTKNNIQLSFPVHHFSHLEISTEHRSTIMLVRPGTRPRYYSANFKGSRKGFTQLDCNLGPTLPFYIGSQTYVTIVCASVNELVVDHVNMFLPSDNSEFKFL